MLEIHHPYTCTGGHEIDSYPDAVTRKELRWYDPLQKVSERRERSPRLSSGIPKYRWVITSCYFGPSRVPHVCDYLKNADTFHDLTRLWGISALSWQKISSTSWIKLKDRSDNATLVFYFQEVWLLMYKPQCWRTNRRLLRQLGD